MFLWVQLEAELSAVRLLSPDEPALTLQTPKITSETVLFDKGYSHYRAVYWQDSGDAMDISKEGDNIG